MRTSRLLPAVIAVLLIGGVATAAWMYFKRPASHQAGGEARRKAAPSFSKPVVPVKPPEDYVGSAACKECHGQICEQFALHPMGRSAAEVLKASPLEDYTKNTGFERPPAVNFDCTLSYDVRRSDSAVVHHESATAKDGNKIYDLGEPVHYSVGSGQRGRSYIIDRGGVLLMSPITWYTQGNRWDLSPGYDRQNLHFSRRVVDGCVYCHLGRMAPVADDPDRFQEPPFHEIAIGCERCHGPGQRHIAYHQLAGEKTGPDPITNPADLPAATRDEVCFQCHLIGEERIPRYGRGEFDFRPGDHLTDIWTVFLKGDGIDGDSTEAVSQVEQMLSSACYRKSNGSFGCVSCHDPHSRPEPDGRDAFYRERCLQCHSAGQTTCSKPESERLVVSPSDSCVHCHMPAVAANDVPHTSQTDHRVLKDPAQHHSTRPQSRRLTIYGENDNLIPPEELDRGRAIQMAKAGAASGNGALSAQAIPILERWLKVVPEDIEAWEALGIAYWESREASQAARALEQALKLDPDREGPLQRLFLVYHESGEYELGVEYGRKLLAVNPWYYEYFGRMAHMLAELGQVREGIAMAERALELNPAAFPIHQWLAGEYEQLGELEKAAAERKKYQEFVGNR